MCVICGVVGCGRYGLHFLQLAWSPVTINYILVLENHFSLLNTYCRYKGAHARTHWEETDHCYSLELETQRVWDYAGDNYVHRLIQSKTDGKLVELNSHGSLSKDGCGSCEYSDSGMTDALLNSKVDMVLFLFHVFTMLVFTFRTLKLIYC